MAINNCNYYYFSLSFPPFSSQCLFYSLVFSLIPFVSFWGQCPFGLIEIKRSFAMDFSGTRIIILTHVVFPYYPQFLVAQKYVMLGVGRGGRKNSFFICECIYKFISWSRYQFSFHFHLPPSLKCLNQWYLMDLSYNFYPQS